MYYKCQKKWLLIYDLLFCRSVWRAVTWRTAMSTYLTIRAQRYSPGEGHRHIHQRLRLELGSNCRTQSSRWSWYLWWRLVYSIDCRPAMKKFTPGSDNNSIKRHTHQQKKQRRYHQHHQRPHIKISDFQDNLTTFSAGMFVNNVVWSVCLTEPAKREDWKKKSGQSYCPLDETIH